MLGAHPFRRNGRKMQVGVTVTGEESLRGKNQSIKGKAGNKC